MSAYERYLKAKKLYDTNEKFHTFVNKCCESYKCDLEFAFNIMIVQEVGEYYAGEKKAEDLPPVNLEGVFDDKSC